MIGRLLLKCADGLAIDDVHDKDVVVMAGMGGRTMQEVIRTRHGEAHWFYSPTEMWRIFSAVENGWYSDGKLLWNESGIFGPVDGTEVISSFGDGHEFGVRHTFDRWPFLLNGLSKNTDGYEHCQSKPSTVINYPCTRKWQNDYPICKTSVNNT